jgi:predicted acetyltransferase
MGIEFRRVRDDAEARAHAAVAEYAFNNEVSDAGIERRLAWYERDWCFAAFDGKELVAGLTVIPFEQYMHGARIPLGGVASVSALPERRRSGLAGGLLRHALAEMRDAGQPLSALWTPHYSLYRRYGWELASRTISYSFPPKVAKLRLPPPDGGSYRRARPGDWHLLADLHERHAASRNGAMARPERYWRRIVLHEGASDERFAVVWSNARAEPRGYAVYRARYRPGGPGPMGETVLRVADWAALDPGAYAAIMEYLRGHDLADRIVLRASSDEPLPAVFDEPVHLGQPPGGWSGVMLRLVDVRRALELRPALPQASGKSLVVELTDGAAPWNAGTWRIEASEGRISVEPSAAPAGLAMDVQALAPIWNGFTKPVDAARAGQIEVRDERALADATDLFAVAWSPYTPEDF